MTSDFDTHTATIEEAADTPAEGPSDAADADVLALYRELLQRDPGAAELAEWREALLSGVPLAEIRAAFIASDEYRQWSEAAERIAAVSATGLFDPDWYLAAYSDVAQAGQDPLAHYCRFGLHEYRCPNAYFDDRWYRRQTALPPSDVALLDYAARGERLGLAPGPNFEPVWYRAAYQLDESESPLAHFLAHRGGGAVAPCPRLWCLARPRRRAAPPDAGDVFTPFLAATGDPIESATPDIRTLEASGLFDRNHYQIINADVADAGLDMLTHYCVYGWKEGRNPNFYFDHRWYVATNPDVRHLQVNPLVHYLLVGEPADRRPIVFFEPGWYRRTYGLSPDVSPLAHYLAHRHTQRFSPNSLFDPIWYRAQCREVPRANRDLFAHYVIFGMRNDMRPSAGFDAAGWRQRSRGRPSRHFTHMQSPEQDNPLVNYMLAHYR